MVEIAISDNGIDIRVVRRGVVGDALEIGV
jgi:hypothetical protein